MKTNRIILVAALGGMLLGGCSRDDGFRDTPNGDTVNFTAGIAAATRTTDGGDTWEVGDAVGIYMLANGGDITAAADVLADNLQYNVADAQTGALSPSDGTPIYYPQSGTVDFIAYYPHVSTVTAGEYNISVSDQTDPAAINVLYAKTTDMSKADPVVRLEFGHVLSKVTLNVKAGIGFEETDISGLAATDVEFSGMPTEASLDLQDGALTVETDLAQTFSPLKDATPPSGFDASFTALLVPQTDGGVGRTLKFTVGGQTYTWSIPETEIFAAGNHYIYPVTVNKTMITVGTVTITDWNTNDNGTEEAEQVLIVPEANCYMVEPNGAPILIPISQANKAADPDYNLGADATGLGGVEAGNFTVELVWGDLPVGADGVIQEIKAYYEFVYVKPGAAGNAVIAIRDNVSNTIKWSWHIWVTEPVGQGTDNISDVTWMDRNLGAGGAGSYQADGKNGLFWQWGRKDAFPGSDGTIAERGNNQIYYTPTDPGGTTANLPTGEYTELTDMVQNPLTFATNSYTYFGSLNVEGEDNDSWGGVSGAKTLYDPCPEGWRVPESGNWSSSSDRISEFNTEWATFANNGRVFNGVYGTSSLGHFYPAMGCRNPSSGALYSIGSYGYYWSGTPYTDRNARFQSFNDSMVYPKEANLRTYGFAVRCVAE